MIKLTFITVLLLSNIGYAKTKYDIPLKYKNKICQSIQGGGIADTYDVKNCLKGTFASDSDFNKSEPKLVSYLGENKRGYKFTCQFTFNDSLNESDESTCIDLFVKNWPKNNN